MNLAQPLRDRLVESTALMLLLPEYLDAPIFTRRPVPDDAPYPLIIISGDVAVRDEDGISDERPVITRDVTVYGQNDTAAHMREVDEIAYLLRTLFHRRGAQLTVPGWNVIDVVVTGPRVAPTDDDQTVGRVITLTVRLSAD